MKDVITNFGNYLLSDSWYLEADNIKIIDDKHIFNSRYVIIF